MREMPKRAGAKGRRGSTRLLRGGTMRVQYHQTLTVTGTLEVPDDATPEEQRRLAREHSENNKEPGDWESTFFYKDRPHVEQSKDDYEDEDDDGTRWYEWFFDGD